MRLCVSIPCLLRKMDVCEAIRTAASLGYDAVETYDWKPLDADAVRAVCDETGVELVCFCTTECRLNEPQYREAFLEGLRESCEAANRLRVGRLITTVGQDTGAPREEQHAAIVEALKLARPILEKHRVILMIEPLNTLVNHKGHYLSSSAEAFDIVREVNSPYVKVLYDIYHQQIMEGNIIPSVTNNLDCIAHLHAGGHPGRHELQLGESDYKNIFDAIDRAGYTGACGLEYFPTVEQTESLATAMALYGESK